LSGYVGANEKASFFILQIQTNSQLFYSYFRQIHDLFRQIHGGNRKAARFSFRFE